MPSEVLFFYVVVRHTLCHAELDDRELADYLAAMLLDFGRRDRAWRVDWNDDQQHRYLADILVDLEGSDGERRFRVMVHLGNYALWLAGLFPTTSPPATSAKAVRTSPTTTRSGRRGFALASDHALADRYGLDGVLRTAAERFPSLRSALNGLSDRVLFPGGGGVERALRNLGIH